MILNNQYTLDILSYEKVIKKVIARTQRLVSQYQYGLTHYMYNKTLQLVKTWYFFKMQYAKHVHFQEDIKTKLPWFKNNSLLTF